MVQEVRTARATDELLLAGIIPGEEFAAFLRNYSIPQSMSHDAPALMLLESQPRYVIEQEAQQELLCFAFFDPTFDFIPYTSGRVFHALGELRWEQQHSEVHIVYTGHKEYKPALQKAREIMLAAYIPRDSAYLLFGKRLDETQLTRIGPVARLETLQRSVFRACCAIRSYPRYQMPNEYNWLCANILIR